MTDNTRPSTAHQPESKANPGLTGLWALAAESGRQRSLWTLLFITTIVALALPLLNAFVIYPAFTHVLVDSIEKDSERIASYLIPAEIKFSEITPDRLTPRLFGDIYKLENNFGIVKIKIYSPHGEVLYSTDQGEIGTRISWDKEFMQVRNGESYTTLVTRGETSRDGERFDYDIVETYVPLMNGKRFLGAFEIYYDITQSKRRLDTLSVYSSLIMIVLAASLVLAVLFLLRKEAANQLARNRALALKNDLDQIVRHDLKSPLIGILSGLQYLDTFTSLDKEQASISSQMRDLADSGLDMINRSLGLYKMEMGTYQYAPEDMDILLVARRVVASLQDLASARKTTLALQVAGTAVTEEDCLPFRAEKTLCYTIMANLIKNAIEASDENDQVTINLALGEDLRLTVHNPAQVPADIRDVFFEKYVTSGKHMGTGLGTYSARLSAEAIGGSIEMETSSEYGTLITVLLPRPDKTEEQKEL